MLPPFEILPYVGVEARVGLQVRCGEPLAVAENRALLREIVRHYREPGRRSKCGHVPGWGRHVGGRYPAFGTSPAMPPDNGATRSGTGTAAPHVRIRIDAKHPRGRRQRRYVESPKNSIVLRVNRAAKSAGGSPRRSARNLAVWTINAGSLGRRERTGSGERYGESLSIMIWSAG